MNYGGGTTDSIASGILLITRQLFICYWLIPLSLSLPSICPSPITSSESLACRDRNPTQPKGCKSEIFLGLCFSVNVHSLHIQVCVYVLPYHQGSHHCHHHHHKHRQSRLCRSLLGQSWEGWDSCPEKQGMITSLGLSDSNVHFIIRH